MNTERIAAGDEEIRYSLSESSLGTVLVAQSDRGVCAVLLGDNPQALVSDLQARFSDARLIRVGADVSAVVERIVAMIEAPRANPDLLLDVRGTAFQQRVWQALRDIPAGQTASYTDVAQRIGSPQSVRAVASACAANPLAVVIPCHRVVSREGHLCGYRWGVERKRALIEREAVAA